MHSTDHTLAPRLQSGLERSSLRLHAAARVVWRFLQGFSQRKAAAELMELACGLQHTRPDTAAQMRRAASRSWD
ncbi:hypothetical protein [Piscinibacter sp. XHJ-5]|uniref:hypothetical protein n=1 Tax=Piscinibacter sp. XHJ-5 TaxID=3037797 RepID=UPI002452FA27|nr:hypothetical protein [Piscinibacter sp. XHJ-5]